MRRLALDDVDQTILALRATGISPAQVRDTVTAVLADVRARGDAALRECTARFDGVELAAPLAVPAETLRRALATSSPELVDALRAAAANVREYHSREAPGPWRAQLAQGQTVGQEIMPLAVAGLYVPGGLANYPSSVLMTAIPAQVAGVGSIVVCSPPRKDGSVPTGVAAACALLGIQRVFPVGGAQAVAAMAYGTQSLPRCDVIVGPGNAYVTEAKRQVMGEVAIDGLAGPSEVLIVADAGAEPEWLAADALAQAEHGAGAMGAVLSLDGQLSDRLEGEIGRLSQRLQIGIDNVTIVDCPSLEAAMELVNAFGPEHLELHVANPERALKQVRSAGAVFLGRHAATAFADYAAGTNHVLPTGGSARFSQGLSVDAFVRRVGVVEIDGESARRLAPLVATIAREEGLRAHALSAELRGGISSELRGAASGQPPDGVSGQSSDGAPIRASDAACGESRA
jgi:histidinol dehydrogenase